MSTERDRAATDQDGEGRREAAYHDATDIVRYAQAEAQQGLNATLRTFREAMRALVDEAQWAVEVTPSPAYQRHLREKELGDWHPGPREPGDEPDWYATAMESYYAKEAAVRQTPVPRTVAEHDVAAEAQTAIQGQLHTIRAHAEGIVERVGWEVEGKDIWVYGERGAALEERAPRQVAAAWARLDAFLDRERTSRPAQPPTQEHGHAREV